MSQPKNNNAVELTAQLLNKRFKAFSFTAYEEDSDGTLHIRTVMNMTPNQGRAFAAKLTEEGAKIDHSMRLIHPDGHIEIFAPAVATAKQNEPESERRTPREVYTSGRGWVKN